MWFNYILCFFFLMILRPPRSTRTDTLFPYTPLFRSGIGNHILVNGGLDDDDPLVPHFTPLLAALPDPELNGEETSTAQTWGPWIQLMAGAGLATDDSRSEEHTSELQSLMRISYAVFCLKKKK